MRTYELNIKSTGGTEMNFRDRLDQLSICISFVIVQETVQGCRKQLLQQLLSIDSNVLRFTIPVRCRNLRRLREQKRAPILSLLQNVGKDARLFGGWRSLDRTRLRTQFPDQQGKYREFRRFPRRFELLRREKPWNRLGFFGKFPTHRNRELFLGNRDLFRQIREFLGRIREISEFATHTVGNVVAMPILGGQHHR